MTTLNDSPRVGVVSTEVATDAEHTLKVLARCGFTAVELPADATEIDVDAVIIPGGFSAGDYLRPGALAAKAPVVAAVAKANQSKGTPVLGIGNGFQVLLEAGLLPGTLVRNDQINYRHTDQLVTVTDTQTPFTCDYTDDEAITLVHKAAWGNYQSLGTNPRVVARYAGSNPNGSEHDVAGVASQDGTVVGLMVHPEYAVEPGFGTDSEDGPGMGTDGLGVFSSLMSTLTNTPTDMPDEGKN